MATYEQIINSIADDISMTFDNLHIVSGVGDCDIYNSEPVRDALLEAVDGDVNIHIYLGPVVSIDEYGRNTLLDISDNRHNVIRYIRKARPLVHYRMTDDNIVFEDPHLAITEMDKRTVHVPNEKQVWIDKQKGEIVYEFENGFLARSNGRDDFLLLRKESIKKLAEKVEENGRSFDFMSKRELGNYLAKYFEYITSSQ